jgi:hypothetical protein
MEWNGEQRCDVSTVKVSAVQRVIVDFFAPTTHNDEDLLDSTPLYIPLASTVSTPILRSARRRMVAQSQDLLLVVVMVVIPMVLFSCCRRRSFVIR